MKTLIKNAQLYYQGQLTPADLLIENGKFTQIAEEINKPKAVRAVGSAIGKNPVLMVIPCHRVVTKTGKIGQYRGGVVMKENLLSLEGHLK